MKEFFGRTLSVLVSGGGWALLAIRILLDLIGYSTLPDDAKVAVTRIDQFLDWLLSVPWWAVGSFALVSTLWLMWVSWPRSTSAFESSAPVDESKNLPTIAAVPKPVSRHEAERKVRVIDELLDKIREFKVMVARGKRFTDPPIREVDPGLVSVFNEALRRTLDPIHQFKHDHKEYQDIYSLIDREPYAGVQQQIAIYANALRAMEKALVTGGDEASIMELIRPQQMGFDAAMKEVDNWREKTESELLRLRQTCASV